MDSKPTYSAPALDKGLDILEILAKTVMPMTMSEISDKAGRSRGEIFRMLQVLELRSYISRNGAGDGYVLTNKLFMLGMERPPVKGIVEMALPVMHRLADEIWQPCHLVVASEEHIVRCTRRSGLCSSRGSPPSTGRLHFGPGLAGFSAGRRA